MTLMPQRWMTFFAAAVLVVVTVVVGSAQQGSIVGIGGDPLIRVDMQDVLKMFQADGTTAAVVLNEWRVEAERGDARMQFNLGLAHKFGVGVSWNSTEALRWFQLAAEQGNAEAQTNLGLMHKMGDGVPQDEAEAERWFSLVWEQEGQLSQRWSEFYVRAGREHFVSPGGTEKQIDIAEVLRSREFRRAVARVVSEHCHYTGIVAPGPVNCFDTPIGTRRSSPSSSYAELLGSQEFRQAVARVVGNGGCNYVGIVNFVRGPIPPGPINCVGIGRSISLRRSGSALLRSQEFGPAVERVVNNNCNYIGGYMFDGFIPPGPIDCGVPR